MGLRSKATSDLGHKVDALGHTGDEGRRRPRKSTVSCQTSVDPCMSEWGNPVGVASYDLMLSEVGIGGERRELKHLSTCRRRNQARDTPSSGERNGYSLNQRTWSVGVAGPQCETDESSQTVWEGRPQKVKALSAKLESALEVSQVPWGRRRPVGIWGHHPPRLNTSMSPIAHSTVRER